MSFIAVPGTQRTHKVQGLIASRRVGHFLARARQLTREAVRRVLLLRSNMSAGTRVLAVSTAAIIGFSTLAFTSPAQAVTVSAPTTVTQSGLTSSAVSARIMRATSVSVATSKIGATYRYGTAGPSSFDCSGLTSYIWKKAGKTIPRTSRMQYQAVKKIATSQRLPGDLVFFFRGGVAHVGVYAGNNMIIHASGTKKGVRKESLSGTWFKRHLTGYGRVA
jgi:cell wall-associated NlpC family hydrolase